MGYKLPKKKKKGLTNDQKLIRKEVRAAVKEAERQTKRTKDQMYKDLIEVIAPIAFKEAVSFCVAIGQEVNRDEFGHGKKRMRRFANRFFAKYDCICGGYVTVNDIINSNMEITGERYEFDFDEMVSEMVGAAKEKRRARGEID